MQRIQGTDRQKDGHQRDACTLFARRSQRKYVVRTDEQ